MTKSSLAQRIEELKREKNAVILAHYYTTSEVQAVADFLGDSLALSVKARDIDAPIILWWGGGMKISKGKDEPASHGSEPWVSTHPRGVYGP